MKPIQMAVPRPLGAARRARVNAGTLGELGRALVDGGRWWMVPMIAVLGLTGLLLVAVAAVEYVAPFVYTIF
jgi:hypothetical protein